MTRVAVTPEMLRWARDRAGRTAESLRGRFPMLEQWERGDLQPTFKQLEYFAKATYAPIGFFFLTEPPVEELPIPDFRTIAGKAVERPSPNLLDTIYVCQQRQLWYREWARSVGEEPREFVGTATVTSDVVRTAQQMRQALGFDLEARRTCSTWTEALRALISQADELGALVMVSGVVMNNTSRPLDTDEFRGFALTDDLAPLVFINGKDTKSAQMFTVAHELAHLWLGQSALSNSDPRSSPSHEVERWCNEVAAELLVPLQVLKAERVSGELSLEVSRLARRFKVSTLVILIRLRDAGRLSGARFRHAYDAELARLLEIPRGDGGNFYLTQAARVSTRLARALVSSTLEGQTLFRDASKLLGIRKERTFRELCHRLGYPV